MSDSSKSDPGSLIGSTTGQLQALSLTLNILSVFISLAAFVYGVTLAYLQRQVWRIAIIRAMVAAQFFNFLRFIFRILLTNVKEHTDSACRVILFMSDAMSLLPVNICVYCVVYLQLVVIHGVSPVPRWPRVLALTIASLLSVVPSSITLYISPHVLGRESICDINWVPSPKEYAYAMYEYAPWAYLPGVVGTLSVTTIAVHLVRTRRAVHRALNASVEQYGPSHAVERFGHTEVLRHALLTIIWFPITPILSLWFNAVLITVYHYKQRRYLTLDCINVVLLCLQSLLLGLPLLVNPVMRAALAKQLQEQRQARHAARSATGSASPLVPLPPPPLPPYETCLGP
ncbi:hypothetical protein H4R19_001578 [Coemansia spiralis]|nr:hypothetical protein H4R19_001578 [Coemansia spiralis]